ncbi:Redoxin domain protein [Sinomonas atrocyanea]|uniref:thioredoxin-dependent peroxiredoxin n=1 Tax=Sinomonas atrocyanea TaxID=37927 RepID=A0A127A5V2_9MICC|nr:thioredoxin-dependent thiol peroxidase [Sinomonas atrocyanea]AMM34005.1 Redoxin domain protein [Sinomonas atrocyanea]GEB65586.1 peroxiredoxin [Sinomonas atrocyanea]GGG78027.1 peroxiredoxin [Sinomonas atrocyanea]
MTALTKLSAGQQAPAFTLPDATGTPVSLEDYRGGRVVVYFYPKAATPGCTTEACDFRDSLDALNAGGVKVIGISPDAVEDIAKFAEDFSLTFPLLADEGAAVAKAWGAWGEKIVNGEVREGILRSTAVVSPEGEIESVDYNVQADGHVAALRTRLGL